MALGGALNESVGPDGGGGGGGGGGVAARIANLVDLRKGGAFGGPDAFATAAALALEERRMFLLAVLLVLLPLSTATI